MRLLRRHPSGGELSRAASEGLSSKLEAHLAECAACTATWSSFTRVDTLARTAAPQASSETPREELLTELLAVHDSSVNRADRVPRSRSPRWYLIAGATALAATAAAATSVALRPDREREPDHTGASAPAAPATPIYRASVRAEPGALFERVSAAPDEVIRVYDGTIGIDVTPLQAGEHVQVIAGDATIEGGIAFRVTASNDTLAAVQVVSGTVTVRPLQRATAVLIAGQRWEAEQPVTHTDEPMPTRPLREPGGSQTRVAARVERSMASLFDRGWRELRAGNTTAAIAKFDEALAAFPSDPLAEDTAFWRGVALVRARRTTAAINAFVGFIERYPSSPRMRKASAMLGWVLIETGDLDSAARRFETARLDPSPDVQDSARRGLAAIEATRSKSAIAPQ